MCRRKCCFFLRHFLYIVYVNLRSVRHDNIKLRKNIMPCGTERKMRRFYQRTVTDEKQDEKDMLKILMFGEFVYCNSFEKAVSCIQHMRVRFPKGLEDHVTVRRFSLGGRTEEMNVKLQNVIVITRSEGKTSTENHFVS